ncbi:hypothetical protein QZH41_013031 [Actinostola sp. cb2023]|nr:hypothetical protein QZH41_013031 [Actinostola sp. cb2023]
MASRATDSSDEFEPPLKRFRKPLAPKEQDLKLKNAIPKATLYKNNWAVNIFTEWRDNRENKMATFEPKSQSRFVPHEEVENLDIKPWEKMSVPSLNFWISKFLQEVCNKKGERYPAKTLYQIVASLKRYLESRGRSDVNMMNKSNESFSYLRQVLDAEMKDVHKMGIINQNTEKLPMSDMEEEKMWESGLFGPLTAKTILNTLYFYNGKLFGMRSKEHRSLRLSDIIVDSETITFKENSSKTYHGGISDLKKTPRKVRHLCHSVGEENHERCLVSL